MRYGFRTSSLLKWVMNERKKGNRLLLWFILMCKQKETGPMKHMATFHVQTNLTSEIRLCTWTPATANMTNQERLTDLRRNVAGLLTCSIFNCMTFWEFTKYLKVTFTIWLRATWQVSFLCARAQVGQILVGFSGDTFGFTWLDGCHISYALEGVTP